MDNDKLNQDLFDIVNGHSYDTYNPSDVNINNTNNFKLSKTESKYMKKCNLNLKRKTLKKMTIASLGTVIVLSSFLGAKYDKQDSQEIVNDISITIIDNQQNDNDINALMNDSEDNDNLKDIDSKISIDKNEQSTFNQKELFEVGNNQYIDYIYKYMENKEYNYFEKNASNYGVPSQIMLAMGMQETNLMHNECLLGGEYYNGCALGIMQLEKDCNNTITAYNYNSNQDELVKYSDEELCNIENNIQVGCMRFQKAIEKYNGNIYVAIQSHNFGEVMTDKALKLTAQEKGIAVDDVLNDYQDLSWMKYIEDIHDNPSKYLSNWEYNTYGDAKYLFKVLSYCPATKVSYQFNGDEYNFDLQYGISNKNTSNRIL